jgi:hypothetical protein
MKLKMAQCKFHLAWIGQCCIETAPFSDFCEEHKDKICCSCGAPATHECNETMGLICGAPLCDNCEHTIYSNGCNSAGWDIYAFRPEGLKEHCRKDQQVYMPWIYCSVSQEDDFNPRTCEHTDGYDTVENIVFCKKCGKITERKEIKT